MDFVSCEKQRRNRYFIDKKNNEEILNLEYLVFKMEHELEEKEKMIQIKIEFFDSFQSIKIKL